MANITKRGNKYRIRVSSGYRPDGTQVVHSMTWEPEPGWSDKRIEKELNKQAVLFEEKIKQELCMPANIKFETFAKNWIAYVEKNKLLRERTIAQMKEKQERAYQAIGHLRMDKITNLHIQAFIDNLSEDGINKKTGGGLSPKTQSHYLTFISDVFEYGVKCNMLATNPCRRVTLPPMHRKEPKCYTLEQAQAFVNRLLETAPIKYQAFFMLAIFGGYRTEELLGLEWKDIDFDASVVTIVRSCTYVSGKGMVTDTTKTQSSQRSLKMPEQVMRILHKHKIAQTEERLRIGDRWIDNDRVFTTWNGRPMGYTSAIGWLRKFCKNEGLEYTTVHSFRHLNASLLINKKADIKTVSAALGHSQTSTTLNIYAHSFAKAQADASKSIAEDLLDKSNKKETC